ncbi:MAG: helix-turn-helix transcriptional regulator [Acutalibacteraceae bacterium]
MKLERLIGILSVLLQNEKVTAPYLAEKFEVSRRTISRDIEVLCQAGIPIVTTAGHNGGIAIMNGYRLDKTLLTRSDMQAILTGLEGLDSISSNSRYRQLMTKLSPSESILHANKHIFINLSSWQKTAVSAKIEKIQAAIDNRKKLHFTYFAPSGESERNIEPYLLLFQWSSWYVWGYCCLRSDFRMFKLTRITNLQITEENYIPREVPQCSTDETTWGDSIQVTVRFRPEVKWRLIEEFGVENIKPEKDGSFVLTFSWSDKVSLYGWLLGFQGQAELLTPKNCREEFANLAENIVKIYREK